MNILKDKFILLISLLVISCSPCNDLDMADFKDNLSTIKKINNELLNEGFISQNNKYLNHEFLKGTIEKEKLKVLTELHFKGVYKIEDVVVYKFQYGNDSNLIEKKVDATFDMSSDITCSYYLFYHPDKNKRNKIAHYEQFAECRKEIEEIDDWTIVENNFPCSD